MPNRLSALVAVSIVAAGCGLIDPVVCTTEAVPAFEVQVVDAATGGAIEEPLVWVRDGVVVDTLEVTAPGYAIGAFERADTYDVHVEAEGYADWTRQQVVVEESECHVRTVEVIARLSPSAT